MQNFLTLNNKKQEELLSFKYPNAERFIFLF